MTPENSCPDVRDLERLLLGRLPPAEADPIAQHLLHCDRCAHAVRSLPGEDSPIAVPAEVPASPPPDQTQLPDGLANFLAPPEGPGELGRLGAYRLTKVIGSGAMAVVFQAEDLRLGREVALKVLKPVLADGPVARRRFLREARATATLNHDNIIAVYQADEDRGLPFLAMPLLKGETLHGRLRRQKETTPPWLPVADVLRIGREIAEGLAAAHERGLIHRDIKPANIWLESKDEGGRMKDESSHLPSSLLDSSFILPPSSFRVKVLDFGIVRVAAENERLTASGALIGTPAFMAPEQAVGGKIDSRCDLFSLGCVLYRMATGQLAFNGPSPPAIINALKNTEPTPPQEINPTLPPALAALIQKLLAKDREQRPGSARDVVAALRAIEEAERNPPLTATVAITPPPQPITDNSPHSHQSTRRNAVPWLLALGAALSVFGIIWKLFG